MTSSNTCASSVTSPSFTVASISAGPATPTIKRIDGGGTSFTGCAGSTMTLSVAQTDSGAGNQLNFNSAATGHAVKLPDNLNSTMVTGFTYEAWIKNTTNATWTRAFDLGSNAFNKFEIELNNNGTQRMALETYSMGNYIMPATPQVSGLGAGNTVPLNTWYHLAVTLDGTTLKFYVNGELAYSVASTAMPSLLGATTNNGLGQSVFAGDASFNGAMDEVKIWNVARTQSQIQSYLHQSVFANTPGLLAYYKMDNNSGTVVTDATSRGNHGDASTLTGSLWSQSKVQDFNKWTYTWSPSTGLSSTTGVSVVAANASTQTYTVVAASPGSGCTNTASQTITVGPAITTPTVVLSSGTNPVCEGNTVRLYTGGAASLSTVLWNTGSTERNINVTTAGTYSFVVTSTTGCQLTSAPYVVTTTPLPAKPVIAASATTLCNASATLTATGNADYYVWNTLANSNTLTTWNAGTYTVRGYFNNGCYTISDPVTLVKGTYAGTAGAITGPVAGTRNQSSNYSIAVVPNTSGYTWTYTGTNTTITGNGTNSISLNFANNATSGMLSVLPTGTCANGTASPAIFIDLDNLQDLAVNSDRTVTGAFRNVTVSGSAKATLTGDLSISGTLQVSAGSTLSTGNFLVKGVVSGVGSFILGAGSELKTENTQGLALTGNTGAVQTTTRSFSNAADYVFNGTAAQQTGNGLPDKVRRLTVANAAGVTLTSPTSVAEVLNVQAGNFNLNNNKLTLLSNASGTARLAKVSGTASFSNAANFTAQRWVDPSNIRPNAYGAYMFSGAPVQGWKIGDWAIGNPFAAGTYDQSTNTGSSVNLFDPSDNGPASYSGWTKPTSPTQAANPGTGARVWFAKSNFFLLGGTVAYKGNPSTGNVNLPVSYCATGTCAGNTATNGWNFVANPYPSPVNWDTAGWTLSNVAPALYIYSNKNQSYSSYVSGVGVNGGSAVLASGQGFMVLANGASPSLTATENVKTTGNPSSLRSAANSSTLRFEFSDESGNTDETAIVDRADAAHEYDVKYDAPKMFSSSINIYSEAAVVPQAISSLNIGYADSVTIGMRHSGSGNVKLRATEFGDLAERYDLFIRDNALNITRPLNAETEIAWFMTLGQIRHFTVLFKTKSVTGVDKSVSKNVALYPVPAHGQFNLTSSGTEMKKVSLYNSLGQLALQEEITGTRATINTGALPAGVYTVHVYTSGGVTVKKLVLEQ
ncbi:MAG: LamG-like jellyroll fold domain-containing protein [Bacteroidota bacterium]